MRNVNQEILKNEDRARNELENNVKVINAIKKELETALASKSHIQERNAEMQVEINRLNDELKTRNSSVESEQHAISELKTQVGVLSAKLSAVVAESDTLKATCKNLRKEKDVLMATYCRAVKENEKLQETIKVVPEISRGTDIESENAAFQKLNQALEKKISRTNVLN